MAGREIGQRPPLLALHSYLTPLVGAPNAQAKRVFGVRPHDQNPRIEERAG